MTGSARCDFIIERINEVLGERAPLGAETASPERQRVGRAQPEPLTRWGIVPTPLLPRDA